LSPFIRKRSTGSARRSTSVERDEGRRVGEGGGEPLEKRGLAGIVREEVLPYGEGTAFDARDPGHESDGPAPCERPVVSRSKKAIGSTRPSAPER
jgi:hypothetical protein